MTWVLTRYTCDKLSFDWNWPSLWYHCSRDLASSHVRLRIDFEVEIIEIFVTFLYSVTRQLNITKTSPFRPLNEVALIDTYTTTNHPYLPPSLWSCREKEMSNQWPWENSLLFFFIRTVNKMDLWRFCLFGIANVRPKK